MFKNAIAKRGATASESSPGEAVPNHNGSTAEPAAAAPLASWVNDEADFGLVIDLLHEVIDPELGVNIVDLGLVFGVRVVERVLHVRMTLTTPGCPLSGYIDDEVRRTLTASPGIDDTVTEIVWDPAWHPEMMSDLAKQQLGWRR